MIYRTVHSTNEGVDNSCLAVGCRDSVTSLYLGTKMNNLGSDMAALHDRSKVPHKYMLAKISSQASGTSSSASKGACKKERCECPELLGVMEEMCTSASLVSLAASPSAASFLSCCCCSAESACEALNLSLACGQKTYLLLLHMPVTSFSKEVYGLLSTSRNDKKSVGITGTASSD